MLSLIVALDHDGVIGVDGRLPWRLPSDLQRFRKLTMDKTVIMGRKTWDSLPTRPLPRRNNIVISRNRALCLENAEVFNNAESVLQSIDGRGEDEAMVIGGRDVFRLFWSQVGKIYCTIVEAPARGLSGHGLVVFPCVRDIIRNRDQTWRCIADDADDGGFRKRGDHDQYKTRYMTYERVQFSALQGSRFVRVRVMGVPGRAAATRPESPRNRKS